MKRAEGWEINDNDQKFIDILTQLGYSRSMAKVIVFFLFFKHGLSADIERTMNMRQPEVSVAVNKLIGKNCIDCSQEKSEGKGRPKLSYTLKKKPEDLLSDIEEQIKTNITKQNELLDELKQCFSNIKE